MSKYYITCRNCSRHIFEGDNYVYDEYYSEPFCDKNCHADFYSDESKKLHAKYFDENCIWQDEIGGI